MSEIWRRIQGFENCYEVSNYGRVRSLDKCVRHYSGHAIKKGKIKALRILPKTGYVQVSLWDARKQKICLVHRLVALAFQDVCGQYFDGAEVDHIDTIRTNNCAENLRWVTRHENHMNPITRKRYSEMNIGKKRNFPAWNKGKKMPNMTGGLHPRAKDIIAINIKTSEKLPFDSVTEASIVLGLSRTAITNNLTKRSLRCGDFHFIYKSKEN